MAAIRRNPRAAGVVILLVGCLVVFGVFLTLLDTHISAVIGALFLFQFGTGPIRGFAYTLLLGLASNLFTSTFVSRTMFELALSRRRQAATLSI